MNEVVDVVLVIDVEIDSCKKEVCVFVSCSIEFPVKEESVFVSCSIELIAKEGCFSLVLQFRSEFILMKMGLL